MKTTKWMMTAVLALGASASYAMGAKSPAKSGVCDNPCVIPPGATRKVTIGRGTALGLVLDQRNGRGWEVESYPTPMFEEAPEGHPLPSNPEWTVIYFTAHASGRASIQLKSGAIDYPPNTTNWVPSTVEVEVTE